MGTLAGRIPAVVWSGALAFALTVLAGGIWTALLISNLLISPAVPWSIIVMCLLLWLMWQYLGGRWPPRSTSASRRRYLRADPVPAQVFAWALVAGLLAIAALAGLWIVLSQLANLRGAVLPDYSKYPLLTLVLILVMAPLVSSLAEEAGFRGYFLVALQRRLPAPAAIVLAALVIAPAHALTQGFLWPTLLFYLYVDVLFGAMAYLTNSIVPGIIVHAIGLLIFFTLVWPGDMVRRLIGQGSDSAWFWIHTTQVVVFTALALLAFGGLVRCRRALARKAA